MDLKEIKNKSWEQLSSEQKGFFENLVKNLKPIQKLWVNLADKKECIYCKKKFEEGILRKSPYQDIPIGAYSWFTTDYLFHLQTTHGYTPDVMDSFLETIKNTRQN